MTKEERKVPVLIESALEKNIHLIGKRTRLLSEIFSIVGLDKTDKPFIKGVKLVCVAQPLRALTSESEEGVVFEESPFEIYAFVNTDNLTHGLGYATAIVISMDGEIIRCRAYYHQKSSEETETLKTLLDVLKKLV